MLRLLRFPYNLVLLAGLAGVALVPALLGYLSAGLPSPASLREVRLPVPLRVYSRDERLIAEFGSERRAPVALEQVPPMLVRAVLAAEDAQFFDHPGVDWHGLARATLHLIKTGDRRQGGSTITMQVARQFFLGREKTFARKFKEILLALRIEQTLAKEEILELYLNKTFFGQRAYGIAAAAQAYYGKDLSDLTLGEVAMIAGLPQAPSRLNPITDPIQAVQRRNYVLRRLFELGWIDAETFRTAVLSPDNARLRGVTTEVDAPNLAEMTRAFLEARLGEDAYAAGLRVYTTLDSGLQAAAVASLRAALEAYDERHGYRGPEGRTETGGDWEEWEARLAYLAPVADLLPALVLAVGERAATVYARGVGEVRIDWPGLSWARRHLDADHRGPAPRKAADVLQPGDIVRVHRVGSGWRLTQLPAVEGALLALDPRDGAIRALVGGLDFTQSQFNRAVQAQRQPGSSFKPFIYSAGLERGLTAASVIVDEPVAYYDAGTGKTWRPGNYDGEFRGPTRLREALAHSRNVVAIRLLETVGVDFTVGHSRLFGIDAGRLPRNLSLALGTGVVTPLELAGAYAVFANGGFRVEPHFIDRVEDQAGNVVFAAQPARACPECPARPAAGDRPPDAPPVAPRVLDPRNAWMMYSMLGDVVRRGTARSALSLKRKDLAGKTGTTNDFQDAWFAGFNRALVAVAWVGFDQLQPLGQGETGGKAALPMWIDFMRAALAGVPDELPAQPPESRRPSRSSSPPRPPTTSPTTAWRRRTAVRCKAPCAARRPG
ncbi:MAG: PBP1A family penicillin-binding protein [Gammaproteobacteria bacterium]|nr:PBP1A family penicillin-binding protein [Gammaproteobacteria bacterium]